MKHPGFISRAVFIIAIMTFIANSAGSAAAPPRSKLLPPFKSIWKITENAMYGESGLSGNTYYYADAKSYGAYSIVTGKLMWRKQFKKEHTSLLTASDGKSLFIAADDDRLLACRLSDGKMLWSTPIRNRFRPITAGRNLLLCELEPGIMTAVSTRTFRPVWKCRLDSAPSVGSAPIAATYLYPHYNGNDLIAINLNNGSVTYRTQLANPRPNPVRVGNRLYVIGYPIKDHQARSGKLWALDAVTGKQIWECKLNGIPVDQPAVLDNLVLVSTAGENGLTAINPANGDVIWNKELPKGSYTSIPVVIDHQILVGAGNGIYSFDIKGNPVFIYTKQDYMMSHPHVRIIPRGFMLSGGGVGAMGFTMGEEEPPAVRIPGLIKQMKNFNGPAMKELAASHDPRAVNYLISQLKDQKASVWVRQSAYRNLTRTGGQAGIKAVSAARDRSRTISPLYRDLTIEDPTAGAWVGKYSKTRPYAMLLAAQKDSEGVLWGLMRMELVGNRHDLWIAGYRNGKWQGFTFTGNSDEKPDLSTWFTAYVGHPSLAKDTDGDGLTDILEQRFGTSIDKTDSDSDGLADSVDKNPLAARRELDDTEQVLAAAFEGYFHAWGDHQSPIIVELPKGMEPIELFGRNGMIFPKNRVGNSPISRLVGEGTLTARFNTPAYNLYGIPIRRDVEDMGAYPIIWNSDRTEAIVGLWMFEASLSAEDCDIRLRKINGTWFVIEIISRGIA